MVREVESRVGSRRLRGFEKRWVDNVIICDFSKKEGEYLKN